MFTIQTERCPGFLRIAVAGRAGVDETCAGALFCGDLLRRTASRRVLFDLGAFFPEFTRADGIDVLSALYSSLPALERLGVVVPADRSLGLLLEVARHRNVPARQFDDFSEGTAWIQEGMPSKGIATE